MNNTGCLSVRLFWEGTALVAYIPRQGNDCHDEDGDCQFVSCSQNPWENCASGLYEAVSLPVINIGTQTEKRQTERTKSI